MYTSIFEIFKIGIGPSSSHTMGPWHAAQHVIDLYISSKSFTHIDSVEVELLGSLAKTGTGHGTQTAIMLGLSGYDPKTIPTQSISSILNDIKTQHSIHLAGSHKIKFNPEEHIKINLLSEPVYHPNELKFTITDQDGKQENYTYSSIGGGFIELEGKPVQTAIPTYPFEVQSAEGLLQICREHQKTIPEIVGLNEQSIQDEKIIQTRVAEIWDAMSQSIYEGCHSQGVLPGGLQVHRRAHLQNKKLIEDQGYANRSEWIEMIKKADHSFKETLNWVSCFALAVNEVNASFGRIVTAPTNGAAGVVPSVLLYHLCFNENKDYQDIESFLFTASIIASLIKDQATISGAMGGCQAEIGVAAAMAAGGLAQVLGGNPERVLMAAEIAMEHHLGLTCDPVGGLVQIPCIERNAMGAMKAITAAQIALASDPHFAKVSLDKVIATMWNTARDMDSKYKETSEGGLAVSISVNNPNC